MTYSASARVYAFSGMKPNTSFLTLIVVLSATAAFAQGPLNPPGAPVPTMKSLDQIEARTPISAVPYPIGAPGSYYLTQNLSLNAGDAIVITSGNVTLDLNGYSISSTAAPAAGTAIQIMGYQQNITIRNGAIKGQVDFSGAGFSGPGFLNGITYSGPDPDNVLVLEVQVFGCGGDGINLGGHKSTTASRCHVSIVGGNGIVAGTVDACGVHTSGSTGIVADTASNSVAYTRGAAAATGLTAKTADHCYGQSDFGIGMVVTTASNCFGKGSAAGAGLNATTAANCRGESVSGIGMNATVADNCYASSVSAIGLSTTTATNSVATSSSGTAGMSVLGTATYCRGTRAGGTAISASIAIGCTTGGGTITAPLGKFLGTP